jgi:hypothetical protein
MLKLTCSKKELDWVIDALTDTIASKSIPVPPTPIIMAPPKVLLLLPHHAVVSVLFTAY